MTSVLHVITGLRAGGAEAALFRLCTGDRKCRHHVISLMDDGFYGSLLAERGVSITSLNMPRGRVTLRGVWKLWRTVRAIQPDVIQTWMYHADLVGGLIARFAGCRNIVWGIRHTDLVEGESAPRTITVARICAKLSRIVPRMIVCCAEKSKAVHANLGYDSGRMLVIPNGYDLKEFAPNFSSRNMLRRQLGLTLSQPVLGFVARYNPQKDHVNLLLALAKLKAGGVQLTCLLVGPGMDTKNIEITTRMAHLGLTRDEVRLLGPRRDIPVIMNALDFHVMSSSFGEAFPNVLAEAMACGTLCISTDVGDAKMIVGATGSIVPPSDPSALAAAIAEMLSEMGGPKWIRRKKAARERVSAHFSIHQMTASYHRAWFGEEGLRGEARK